MPDGQILSEIPGSTVSSINHNWLSQNAVSDNLYTGGNGSWGRLKSTGFSEMAQGIKNSKQRNDGEKFEDGMVAYAEALGISLERRGQPGIDLELVEVGGQNRTYELKKSENNTPNMMLNSTFPKSDPNHYYVFVVNLPKFGGPNGLQSAWRELEQEVGEGNIGQAFDNIEKEVQKRRELNGLLSYFEKSASARDDAQTFLGGDGPKSVSIQDLQEALTVTGDMDAAGERAREMLEADASARQNIAKFNQLVTLISSLFNVDKDAAKQMLFGAKGTLTKGQIQNIGRQAKKVYSEQSGLSGGTLGKKFKRILGDVKMWMVPSRILRLEILKSAFPEGAGTVFNGETGEMLPGGRKTISVDIKNALDSLRVEDKIAEKIAPIIQDQIENGSAAAVEDPGFSFRLGLLKVRIKIAIEPPTSVN